MSADTTPSADRPCCEFCHEPKELRPYGPNGERICFECMKATPERERAAEQRFAGMLAVAEAGDDAGTAMLTDDGPIPFSPRAKA